MSSGRSSKRYQKSNRGHRQVLARVVVMKDRPPTTGSNGSILNSMVSRQPFEFSILMYVTEAELEAKVRRIAQVEIMRTQLDMKKELDSRSKTMRDFVST